MRLHVDVEAADHGKDLVAATLDHQPPRRIRKRHQRDCTRIQGLYVFGFRVLDWSRVKTVSDTQA